MVHPPVSFKPELLPDAYTAPPVLAVLLINVDAVISKMPFFRLRGIPRAPPLGRAIQPSQRQASCLGILPNVGTSERIIGEALSISDKRQARWICKTDVDSEISPQEASIFLEEINQYGCTVAVKRGRGDVVYGRIESNEMMQPVEHWDANYVKKWMLSTGSGAGRMEVWNHFHTFLSLGRGDCEDHAILLCSLLLGFGLDAYVCVGTVREPNGASIFFEKIS